MSNAAVKVNEKVNGVFSKDESEKFLGPLFDFQKICGCKLSVRFNKDNTISFRGINEGKSVISYIEYLQTSFPHLKVAEESQAHIYELDEFVSLSKIFAGGFTLVFNDTEKRLELTSSDVDNPQSFFYYLSDETVIPKCPVALKLDTTKWFAKFTWDSKKYANFVRGMSSLKHPYIIFEGKAGESSLTLSVTENKMKTTTLKTVIKLEKENTDSFKVILDKENFLNPVTSSINLFEVDISTKITRLVGASSHHKATYYVTSVADTNE